MPLETAIARRYLWAARKERHMAFLSSISIIGPGSTVIEGPTTVTITGGGFTHQGHARNAGGKAEVILDLRT